MSRVMDRLCFIEPQLPTLAEQPPQGSRWIHEVKHDGYRVQLVIERGNVRLYTRNGYDWSDKFPGIVSGSRNAPLPVGHYRRRGHHSGCAWRVRL